MQTLKPTVWIGKKGCTPEALAEIRRQLEGKKPVKVRFLRGSEMDPGALAAETGGEILGVRGRTVVLKKSRR
jgi:RNA-binding protein